MTTVHTVRRHLLSLSLAAGVVTLAACASSSSQAGGGSMSTVAPAPNAAAGSMSTTAPTPDPRVGLRAGLMDAGEAVVEPAAAVEDAAVGEVRRRHQLRPRRSRGNYAIQGNYNGFQVWDISNPAAPTLKIGYLCPASQSDVSVYKNLLFVSGEGTSGRLDCGAQGVHDTVSTERLRGIRIFDITDIANPKYIANVQTCRGSHTHTVRRRPERHGERLRLRLRLGRRALAERAGRVLEARRPTQDPNSALFRIEVIKVPLAHPEQAAIVSSPRIFNDLTAPPSARRIARGHRRGRPQAADARAKGGFTAKINGMEMRHPAAVRRSRCSTASSRRGAAPARRPARTAPRCAERSPASSTQLVGAAPPGPNGVRPGPNQCHDITVYPAIGLAGGACGGLRPAARHPRRRPTRCASAPWPTRTSPTGTRRRSTTTAPRCCSPTSGAAAASRSAARPTSREWGADAIFTHRERQADVPELLQDAGAADASSRTASRTTAR